MNEDPGFADDGRGLCRYRCESESYKALYSAGVCSEGYVPYFYGLLEHINPKDIPSLSAFTNDTRLPNAILLEYLPNASSFSIENFSRELFHLASEGLKTVHNARVIHNDPYLKNVLVSEAEAGGKRVVWMDFDIAIVFPTDSKMRGSLDLEEEIRLEREFFECVSGRVVSSLSQFCFIFFCFLVDLVVDNRLIKSIGMAMG